MHELETAFHAQNRFRLQIRIGDFVKAVPLARPQFDCIIEIWGAKSLCDTAHEFKIIAECVETAQTTGQGGGSQHHCTETILLLRKRCTQVKAAEAAAEGEAPARQHDELALREQPETAIACAIGKNRSPRGDGACLQVCRR